MDYIEINNNSDFSILVTHQPIKLDKLQNYPVDLEVA
jgi:predicted MPP superfamily phosphohydrolase